MRYLDPGREVLLREGGRARLQLLALALMAFLAAPFPAAAATVAPSPVGEGRRGGGGRTLQRCHLKYAGLTDYHHWNWLCFQGNLVS